MTLEKIRILFLGLNYYPEQIGISIYSTGLCEDLAANGHSVRAIVAAPYYPNWRVFDEYRTGWSRSVQGKVDITRCPLYVPRKPSGLKRLFHHTTFALSAIVPTLLAAWRFKPQIVVTIAPSLVASPLAWVAAKIAKAPSWLHVQDFEVEAAFATGLLDARSTIAKIGVSAERRIINLFDHVSSISPEMCAKLRSYGVPARSISEFRNWAEIDLVYPLQSSSAYREEWNIRTEHVALYSGNIGNKQGIELVIDAARRLVGRTDLTFVICGEGPNRKYLEAEAKDLLNIRFHDLQPPHRLGDLLGLASVHLLPQKAGAADLVLPSKLTNMLASGRPVLATAAIGTGLAREIVGCGIVVPPGDAAAFSKGIERLIDDQSLRTRYSRAARARAEERWNRKHIMAAIELRLHDICFGG